MNIEQAAQHIVKKIRGKTIEHIDAVRRSWPNLQLSQKEIKHLAQEGLLYAHVRKLLTGRNDIEYVDVTVTTTEPPPAEDLLLTVCYKMEDGNNRVFIDWTPEDCSFTQRRFRSQIIGLSHKVTVLETAKTLMRKYQKGRIGDLPEDARQKLREDWRANLD